MDKATIPLMPAAFLGHGSPMNALETNRYTSAWHAFGASVPRPRAILVVSAHWFVNVTAVTAMQAPRTIHDFFGFPRELFEIQYPAPGAPDLAAEVAEIAKPDRVGLDHDSWGIDHGTWSVLLHAFPRADVPVVQLSINAQRPFDYHVALGARLSALRSSGVLIVGSGNVVHNLRALDRADTDGGYDWTRRFDAAARNLLGENPGEVASLASHRDFNLAVPTAEHFVPLLYLAGLCAAAARPARVLVDGYSMGSLSMTSFTLDASCPPSSSDARPAAGLPDAGPLSPEDTNL
jgi:4,5-DOPA dioxygenase extradiol